MAALNSLAAVQARRGLQHRHLPPQVHRRQPGGGQLFAFGYQPLHWRPMQAAGGSFGAKFPHPSPPVPPCRATD